MKNCSEMIRALREDHDLTQTDVAKVLGTSQQYYSKYENERIEIPVRVVAILADYYGVSTDYLLGRVEYSASVQSLDAFLAQNTALANMLSTMQQLSPQSQQAVFEYVSLQQLKEKSQG